MAVVTSVSRVDAFEIDHSASTNRATYTTLKVTPAALELHFRKGDLEAIGTDLANPSAIIKVDVPKSNLSGFLSNGAATLSNGFSSKRTRVDVAIVPICVLLVSMSAMDIGQFNGRSIGCVHRLGERWFSEEQGRRNGKRSSSDIYDAVHHSRRETHPDAT
ncbi:MAG: hypothetical protein AAFO63_06195 [Pseudomonadota bacterium]